MMTIVNSGIIVISILLIRKLTMHRIASKYRYSFWIFLAIYLLLSPFVHYESRFSIEGVMKNISLESVGREGVYDVGAYPLLPDVMQRLENTNHEKWDIDETEPYIEGEASNLPFNVWTNVKMAVSIMLAAVLFFSNIIFGIKCKKKRIFFKRDIETNLNVYLLDDIYSPFLLGQAVYLAPFMTKDAAKMRYMIMHEYCHHKHKDLQWNVIKWGIFILYWYNPFVWLAMDYVKRDCELACDESVIELIGNENKIEYAKTLLELLTNNKKTEKHYSITTMMKGGKNQMKERIKQLVEDRSNSYAVIILSCICILVLTGCAFSKTKSLEEKEEIEVGGQVLVEEEITLPEGNAEGMEDNHSLFNDYYNYCKFYGEYLYYADAEHLYRVDINSKKYETLLNGKCKLGNISAGYIYYLKQASENDISGIFRMNLRTLKEELLVQWEDDLWRCSNIFAEGDEIYLEMGNDCTVYRIENGMAVLAPKEENKIINSLNELKIDVSNMNQFASGYVNTFFLQNKVVYHNGNSLLICDLDNHSVSEINNYKLNILVTDRGVVYTGTDGKIWIKKWESKEAEILYEGDFLNYGAYNENYIFVFEETENSVKCFKLSYDGKLTEVICVDNMNRAIDLLFSAYENYICFYDNHQLEVVSLQ